MVGLQKALRATQAGGCEWNRKLVQRLYREEGLTRYQPTVPFRPESCLRWAPSRRLAAWLTAARGGCHGTRE